ncbi:GntR family transcriptional regulator [Kitasatospora sp. MAP12-15]|uniref:GntR family transcriptional regulator n=1 Tax=unclassified Kitasatospora TaxID=2633591 RepID=UPI0024736D10|nr:GntR family transcriptional regulator [Kitasatospora sp. MAP12-44]MDH6112882.1 GntR family transcriptional regulator [Kitasatospora sp. MAP12-44]
MNAPAYRQVATDLRAAIERGDYPEGSALPKLEEIAQQYGIAKQTAREAISELENEGLVEPVRRRGTVVRPVPARLRLQRTRTVYRDERGYYFDPAAQPWVALEQPTVGWGPAPRDIAPILGVRPGEDVLIRDRLMGDPDTREAKQLATSYLPADLSRGTRLAESDTGPGGIYDLLEQMGHGPLAWHEGLGARMPSPREAERLALPKGVPLLRVVRTTTSPAGTVLEVNDTRMSGDAFEFGYTITRDPSAHPAT